MDTDKFSDLPEWEDGRFGPDEEDEGEEWKPNPTREACAALYKKWQEVVFLLKGVIMPFIEGEEDEEDIERSILQSAARDLYGDAHIVAVKIKSSEAGDMYVLRMENAAIIRKLAQGIATGLLLFTEDSSTDESHIMVIRNEINAFRLLFVEWVKTFEKDEFTDEWGLFV